MDLVSKLGLVRHVEGGFYRETHRSTEMVNVERGTTAAVKRNMSTLIYYLLNAESSYGRFHRNKSDIIHLNHEGRAMYRLLDPLTGKLTKVVLGNRLDLGDVLQLVVPGGVWKSSQLMQGSEYSLISEVVAPGFDFEDHEFATEKELKQAFPLHWHEIHPFVAG